MRGIFLDIETTGLDPVRHVPIDIACAVIDMSEGRRIAQYQSLIQIDSDNWNLADPNSLLFNGYTFEELQKGLPKRVVAENILELLAGAEISRKTAFFICQNPAFDRGFFNQIIDVYTQDLLNWPYHWLDLASMYWALYMHEVDIARQKLPEEVILSKDAIAHASGLPPEPRPHCAKNGVEHLIQCYEVVVGWPVHSQSSSGALPRL